MGAYASRRRHSYITNIFKYGKRGMSTQAFYTMLHRAKVWIRKKYGIEYEELDEI